MFDLSVALKVNGQVPEGYQLTVETEYLDGKGLFIKGHKHPVEKSVLIPQRDNRFTIRLEKL